MTKLKDIDFKIIFELMKNSKISDRELAKKIGVSQPTVSRKRAKLEKEGLLDYTAIPDLKKLGFQIMAFSFSKWTPEALTELLPREEFEASAKVFFTISKRYLCHYWRKWSRGDGLSLYLSS